MNHNSKSVFSTRWLVVTALLAALSFILSFFEIPMPLSPSYIKLDFSDTPALISTFAMGPLSGLMVELVKNLLCLLTSTTGGVGQLANFTIGGSMVLVAGVFYKHNKTRRHALIGILLGSIAMGITGALMNYFVLLPLFSAFMPIDQIIHQFSLVLPFIHDTSDIALYHAFPFSVFKGLVVGGITLLLYKKLSPILKG